MRKKDVSRGLGAVTLALLLTAMFVATAASALAHHPEITARAECQEDGSYLIDGTATAWNGSTAEQRTNLGIEVRRDGYSGTLVAIGAFTVDNGFSFEWDDTLPADTDFPKTYVVIATQPWASGEPARGEDNLDPDQTYVVGSPEEECTTTTTTTPPPSPSPDPTGAIGDLVWEDTNGDGHQGDFEPGIAGVTVNLIGSSGLIIDTMVTDASGNYLFTGLPGGDYDVQFVAPAGFEVSPLRATTPAADSDAGVAGRTGAIALASGETDLTWDAGMYRTPAVLPQVITATTSTTAASVTVETLPFTGSAGTDAAGLGVALLTLGGLLVLMTRSREEEMVAETMGSRS